MYTFESRIRYSECDLETYLTIESLVDYFQDCSTFQTQEGPATMEAMAELGLAWVLNSWQIVVKRLPKLGESVVIGTVPYELKGFMGLRNFFMKTSEGEELAIANSVWSLINLEKGTFARINDDIVKTYPLDEKLSMNYASRKITEPEGAMVCKAEKKIVGVHHLDTNNHVNNGQYIRIALKACENVAERENLQELRNLAGMRENIQIRAEYKKQAHLGDAIYPEVHVFPGSTGCIIKLAGDDNNPYCTVEISQIES